MEPKFNSHPTVEGLSKEMLVINPFPGVLSEADFQQARREGQNFFTEYMKGLDTKAHEEVSRDHIYSAYLTRTRQSNLARDFYAGKVTEDYGATILLEDPVMASSGSGKLEAVRKVLAGIKTLESGYDENLSEMELYRLYEDDPTGKSVMVYLATQKVWHAIIKLGIENSDDIIGTDVGVFFETQDTETLTSPEDKNKEIKPTHKWLRRPKTKTEMREMLKSINGKTITIVVGLAFAYKILKSGPILSHTEQKEMEVSILPMTNQEIELFVEKYFELGKNIAGGVDYSSFGKEIIAGDSPQINYDSIITPIDEIKKAWAKIQVIKRAAQMKSLELANR